MNKSYQAFENLQQHRARLQGSVQLGSGIQLAAWRNDFDCVTQRSDHHTLSLYIEAGFDTWHKTPTGWRDGGGPDRFCLMPENSESTWDIRSEFSFVHLYCTDEHLRHLAEQIWDKSPASISLDEMIFCEDPRITQLYRHFLLSCDWQQNASHLTLSSASTLLMTHLLQYYSQLLWKLPMVRGGLAPTVLRNVMAYIEENLAASLTLGELANQAALSEFHFARMFKQSTRLAPHQYVMQRRMVKAELLLRHSKLPLTEIALQCGFNSSSHFSHRFKSLHGMTPSALRR
ncbi:helix-turn-helix domain-containing protein [Erwinia amylovora]